MGGRGNTFIRLDGRGVSGAHATLLSAVLNDKFRPPQTEVQQNDALAESLQDPFVDESKRIKKEIASTLVPVVNRVKAAYRALDQHVDTVYGRGIVQFNKACTDIETTMAVEQAEFGEAYEASQVILSYILCLLSLTTSI